MSKGWKDDFEAMALKTVYRQLIGKWGLMSIDYRTADAETLALATAIAEDGSENVIDLGAENFSVVEEVAEPASPKEA
jgi:recombination protein RecT